MILEFARLELAFYLEWLLDQPLTADLRTLAESEAARLLASPDLPGETRRHLQEALGAQGESPH